MAIKKLHVRELDEEMLEEFRKEIAILTCVRVQSSQLIHPVT